MKIDNCKVYMDMLREKMTAKTNLKRQNKFGGIILAHIKIYYKATIINKLWYLAQGKTKRYNGTEWKVQKETHMHSVT